MKNSAFPRRYFARDIGHYVKSPELAMAVWQRLRLDPNKWPTRLTWYATDMEVLGTDSIRLFVYDMEDNFYGGIGKQIYEQVVTEFAPAEKLMLDQLVLDIYSSLAEDELQKREDAARVAKILEIRKEMFGI